MEEWEKIRKKYCRIEVTGIAIMAAFFAIGMVLDGIVRNGENILIPINDIESFSLAVLQMQVTIGTLTVAIIALLAGNISDSYMGISVSDFYLNIRPQILKQVVLIFLSLTLCILGLIFHVFKFYNTVFYLYISTLIAIFLSIYEIYSAFKGRNTEIHQIEAYIKYIIESKTAPENKEKVCQNFVVDWKNSIAAQDRQSYEKYLGIFMKSIHKIWETDRENGLPFIQKQCYNISLCLLGADKDIIKERGIRFVEEIYAALWRNILKDSSGEMPVSYENRGGFSFFSEIYEELSQSIERLNIENVEKFFSFSRFSDLILRVSVYLNNSDGNRNENTLCAFSRFLGVYLNKQRNRGNIVNINIWIDVLNRRSIISAFNIPSEKTEVFLKFKTILYFNYCYGMLMSGQEDVVKIGLYYTGLNNTLRLDNKYHALLYLSVHCYIYYLGECEDESCVSDNIKLAAQNILNDPCVKNSFKNLTDMLAENCKWLDRDFLKQLYEILDHYELFPKYEAVKRRIMEFVVSDYYLFLVLFISYEYDLKELPDRNIDDISMLRYVLKGNEKTTIDTFRHLFEIIFGGNRSEGKKAADCDLMYDILEKIIRKKQKERKRELYRQKEKEYEEKIDADKLCKIIKENVIKRIRENFSSLLIDEENQSGVVRIPLLVLDDYTDAISDKILDGYYSDIDGNFLRGIQNLLRKRNVLEVKKRFEDFKTDQEYMEYLENNKLRVLLGSKYVLKNRDYSLTDEFKQFLENRETIYTSVIADGMALKKNSVQVCLHDVNVSIHLPGIRESDAEYDEITQLYKYEIICGLPIEFEKKELEEFLCNSRKIVNITAKISVIINEIPAGTILVGETTKRRESRNFYNYLCH